MTGQVGGQRLYPIALGGVMSGSNISDPGLARQMHIWLRNFAREIDIDAQVDRLLKKILRPAGTPGDATDPTRRVIAGTDHLRRPAQCLSDDSGELGERRRRLGTAVPADILLAKPPLGTPSQPFGKLHVVAELTVTVERQVIGDQIDVMLEQRLQTRLAKTGDATILAAPKPAMMHQNGISLARDRRVDQRLAGGYASHDAPYLAVAFHLQAVWAIIAKAFRFKQLIEIARQFFTFHTWLRSSMRRLWLIFAQTVTVSLAVLFVVSTLKPEWLGRPAGPGVVALQESSSTADPINGAGSYRDAAQKALPSVVHVFTSQKIRMPRHPLVDDPLFRHFFGDAPEAQGPTKSGLGSGVIVSANGYILTNFHVVDGAEQIEVSLQDGRNLNAHLVGGDPESDLAVLQIDLEKSETLKLPAITLGQMDNVSVGDVVLAIGNPFGVGQTVTMGIVSALGRSHLGINTFENFIQTDAAINPGNSGGALTDTHGNLVGINTAIYSRSGGSLGIGFAIPISTAKNVMEQIIETGAVTRGWIGVEVQEITRELAESFNLPDANGALIAGVQRGSPADAGGIKPGDILLQVNGKPVKDPQGMLDLIAKQKPGETIPFELRRQKALVNTTIRIGKRPPPRREAQ
jgi:serine protease DegQ